MTTDHQNKLVEALNAIYEPTSSPSIRLEAQNYIETNQESIETAIKLITATSFPVQIRYHGFHILSTYIKTLNLGLITDLKIQFHSILSQKSLVSKLMIKKFADIYSTFIMKTWPVNYIELDQILAQNFQINPEIILYTLKQMMQDIFVFDHQPSNKKEIVCALHGLFMDTREELNEQSSEYQKYLKKTFPLNIGWFLRIKAVLQQVLQTDQTPELVILLLELIQTTFEWFPLNSIDVETVTLLQTTTLNLNPEIKKASLEALIVLYKRHYGQHDQDSTRNLIFLAPMLESGYLIELHKLFMTSDYQIQKLIANLLTEFLINQICFKRNLDYQPKILKNYIEFMIICSKHDSVFVSKIIYNGFITAFRHPFIKTLVKDYVDLFLGLVLFTLSDEFVKTQTEGLDMDDCGRGDLGMMTVLKLELCGFLGELNSFESYMWINKTLIESFQTPQMQKHVVRMFESLVSKIPREIIVENQNLQGVMKKLLEDLLVFETNVSFTNLGLFVDCQ
jgi:VanZ family protein